MRKLWEEVSYCNWYGFRKLGQVGKIALIGSLKIVSLPCVTWRRVVVSTNQQSIQVVVCPFSAFSNYVAQVCHKNIL